MSLCCKLLSALWVFWHDANIFAKQVYGSRAKYIFAFSRSNTILFNTKKASTGDCVVELSSQDSVQKKSSCEFKSQGLPEGL